MASVGTLYDRDGHLDATFVVARLAGWEVAPAIELSCGAQLPDDRKELKAVPNAWRWPFSSEARKIMSVLHSLHGSDVQRRRGALSHYISKVNVGLDFWKLGVLIHAYGDSYAHTYMKRGREVAYGAPFGHLWHGHKPDQVPHDPAKFNLYVGGLYSLLEAKVGGPGQGVSQVQRISKESDFEERIQSMAISLGYDLAVSKQVSERLERVTSDKVLELLVDLELNL